MTAMSQNAHTPTPYEAQNWRCHAKTTVMHVTEGGKKLVVAECETEEDAAFIAQACNSHAALVDAAQLGHDLSTWAASINWGPNATNTEGWLEGLRERIEAVQKKTTALKLAGVEL